MALSFTVGQPLALGLHQFGELFQQGDRFTDMQTVNGSHEVALLPVLQVLFAEYPVAFFWVVHGLAFHQVNAGCFG